jgi:hypothetical protein
VVSSEDTLNSGEVCPDSFTRFTRTKVQMLTKKALADQVSRDLVADVAVASVSDPKVYRAHRYSGTEDTYIVELRTAVHVLY